MTMERTTNFEDVSPAKYGVIFKLTMLVYRRITVDIQVIFASNVRPHHPNHCLEVDRWSSRPRFTDEFSECLLKRKVLCICFFKEAHVSYVYDYLYIYK